MIRLIIRRREHLEMDKLGELCGAALPSEDDFSELDAFSQSTQFVLPCVYRPNQR